MSVLIDIFRRIVRLQGNNVRASNAHFPNLGLFIVLILLLASCGPETPANALGEAYVAPGNLNLHSSLTSKSATVAVLKHGDHLNVIDVKRRYVKVRTDKGAEGWLDSRQLLSKEQMDQLRKQTQLELRLPSQGRATTFDALNVHIDSDRRSPAFTQIASGASVDVLAHAAVPKVPAGEPPPAPSFLKPQAPQLRHVKKPKPQKGLPLRPPMPTPPKPPANWQDLSSERIDGPTQADELKQQKQQHEAKKAEETAKKPVVLEDWTLVRTTDKKVGWVLARNLYMAVPDEVAQYAEGQRISSYFDLGAVQDEEKGTKHNWLWTTSSEPQPFDFDRFRVFLWNRRRHRYETSYRQRDLVGYFPVEVEPGQPGDPQRRFSLILQGENGNYFKKRFVFDGTRVHLVSSERYQPAATGGPTKAAPLEPEKLEAKRPVPGWLHRQLDRLRRYWNRKTSAQQPASTTEQ
jgi:hypothetical protein